MAMKGLGHLLHVGFAKTGSKLLQRWFEAHPDLGFAPWGIAGFANAHHLVASAATAAPGDGLWRVTSHEALLTPVAHLEDPGREGAAALPTRQGQDSACDLLVSLFPQATVLIVTRGFAELIRAFHAELILGGGGYDLESLCAALLDQVRAGSDAFDVDHVLARYARAFGEDRLIVLPYELLRDRPGAFFAHIEERLGLDPFPFAAPRVRPSPPSGEVEAYRRLTRLVRRVPGTPAVRRRLGEHWVAALRSGRLAGIARRLASSRGGGPAAQLPEALVEALRGRTERLRGNSLYAGLEREYLF
jgi:hypothetical protein